MLPPALPLMLLPGLTALTPRLLAACPTCRRRHQQPQLVPIDGAAHRVLAGPSRLRQVAGQVQRQGDGQGPGGILRAGLGGRPATDHTGKTADRESVRQSARCPVSQSVSHLINQSSPVSSFRVYSFVLDLGVRPRCCVRCHECVCSCMRLFVSSLLSSRERCRM